MDQLMAHRTFINGNWWERFPGYGRYNNRIEVNKWMGPAETADVYNSAKIIINLHRAVDDDDINQNRGHIPAASQTLVRLRSVPAVRFNSVMSARIWHAFTRRVWRLRHTDRLVNCWRRLSITLRMTNCVKISPIVRWRERFRSIPMHIG